MIRLFLILFLISTPVWAFENEMLLANQKEEAKAEKIFKSVRCLVCKGESLAESNAELAVNMRGLIRDKIAAGQSEADIKEYLVSRYGETILQKPPFEAKTYVLWLMPLVLLIIGGIIIARIIKHHGQSGRSRTS